MGETFHKKIRVMEFETDLTQRIRLSSIMRHSQQIGSDHLREKKIDYNQMYRDGMVFIVNKMKISIHRRPVFGEELLLETIPMAPKGVQFVRDTAFRTLHGEELVYVSISWALIDPQTRKILRPRVFEKYGFDFCPNDQEHVTSYKIHMPKRTGVHHIRQVKYSDMDYNGHINNASYADIICDALPLHVLIDQEIKEFGILYHKEACAGQVLEMDVIEPELPGNPYIIAGKVENMPCFTTEILFE